MTYFCGVQSGDIAHNSTCKCDLDSLLQLRHGVRLNTSRQARAACGVVSSRIASTPLNRQGGDFTTSLNREPASCHSRPLRPRLPKHTRGAFVRSCGLAVLCCGPSHPRKWNTQHTYRTEMENISALIAGENSGLMYRSNRPMNGAAQPSAKVIADASTQSIAVFFFFSLYERQLPHEASRAALLFLWGDSFVFRSCFFFYTFSNTKH